MVKYSDINSVWGVGTCSDKSTEEMESKVISCDAAINHIVDCERCYKRVEQSFHKQPQVKDSMFINHQVLLFIVGIIVLMIIIFYPKSQSVVYPPLNRFQTPLYQIPTYHHQPSYGVPSPQPPPAIQITPPIVAPNKWSGNYNITFSPT